MDKNKAKRDKMVSGSRHVLEEKNKFALSVLRRVRVKLEGREPDSLRKVIYSIFRKLLTYFLL